MTFPSFDSLLCRFSELGVRRVLCKPLAENDNSKQQIYLGKSYEVLQLLPFKNIAASSGVKRQNFKASLDFWWINVEGHTEQAPGAQLILYPDYPEVRLSGFLKACSIAPKQHLQPLDREQRQHFNTPDGRLLFLGVTEDKRIYAWLALSRDPASNEFMHRCNAGEFEQNGVFWQHYLSVKKTPRQLVIDKLKVIHAAGWHDSKRLDKNGQLITYNASNGGGYTLEALFGILPNGKSEPDFQGWELKTYGKSRITLMTPEPDAGFYGQYGVKEFVQKYGHQADNDVRYFTGAHRLNHRCEQTGQTLTLRGYDKEKREVTDVTGGIELIDSLGHVSATWTFIGLIAHWSRKHANTAYVPYERNIGLPPQYHYNSPILICEGTEFPLYLDAMLAGHIIYDPASKVLAASSSKPTVKARSQFRISKTHLRSLYHHSEFIDL